MPHPDPGLWQLYTGILHAKCSIKDVMLYMFLFQHKFRIGDPVWAKMKGFSPWPGVVALPPGNNHSYFVLYCIENNWWIWFWYSIVMVWNRTMYDMDWSLSDDDYCDWKSDLKVSNDFCFNWCEPKISDDFKFYCDWLELISGCEAASHQENHALRQILRDQGTIDTFIFY